MRFAWALLGVATLIALPGCFICILEYGTGRQVVVVEHFMCAGMPPEPLPPAYLEAMRRQGNPTIVVRYRVPKSEPASGRSPIDEYFSSLLEERRLPWTTPYLAFNGIPALLGGPLPGATGTTPEFGLAPLGLYVQFEKEGTTRIGWWTIGDSSSLGFDADLVLLRGAMLDVDPPVFEVADLHPLGRHGREDSIDLPFIPPPEEAIAILARDADSLEILNILWLSPEERRGLRRNEWDDGEMNTDLIELERPARRREPQSPEEK